jgi:hypothetical protein
MPGLMLKQTGHTKPNQTNGDSDKCGSTHCFLEKYVYCDNGDMKQMVKVASIVLAAGGEKTNMQMMEAMAVSFEDRTIIATMRSPGRKKSLTATADDLLSRQFMVTRIQDKNQLAG